MQGDVQMSTTKKSNLRHVMRDSARMYFAPLVGAFIAIRNEARRIDHPTSKLRRAKTADRTAHITGGALINTSNLTTINVKYITCHQGKVWALEAEPSTTLAYPDIARVHFTRENSQR